MAGIDSVSEFRIAGSVFKVFLSDKLNSYYIIWKMSLMLFWKAREGWGLVKSEEITQEKGLY